MGLQPSTLSPHCVMFLQDPGEETIGAGEEKRIYFFSAHNWELLAAEFVCFVFLI